MKQTLFVWIALLGLHTGHAQDLDAYEKKCFIQNGDTLRYRILYPLHYDSHKKYPLVVFLHGSGERGSDNQAQLLHGGDFFLKEENRRRFPAIVVFPQCPANQTWSNLQVAMGADSVRVFSFPTDQPVKKPLALVTELIHSLVKEKKVDARRIYVGGLSLGGFGTFEILWRNPKLFAAAFPICGGGATEVVVSYADHFPVWIFHGGKDNVVPPDNSRKMYAALKAAGAAVKYTEFPEANHNSWDSAFAEKDLLPWLFAQRRK